MIEYNWISTNMLKRVVVERCLKTFFLLLLKLLLYYILTNIHKIIIICCFFRPKSSFIYKLKGEGGKTIYIPIST